MDPSLVSDVVSEPFTSTSIPNTISLLNIIPEERERARLSVQSVDMFVQPPEGHEESEEPIEEKDDSSAPISDTIALDRSQTAMSLHLNSTDIQENRQIIALDSCHYSPRYYTSDSESLPPLLNDVSGGDSEVIQVTTQLPRRQREGLQRESSQGTQRDSLKSIQRDGLKSAQRDGLKSAQRDGLKSTQREPSPELAQGKSPQTTPAKSLAKQTPFGLRNGVSSDDFPSLTRSVGSTHSETYALSPLTRSSRLSLSTPGRSVAPSAASPRWRATVSR